jgi:chromosome segregation ATPase
MELNEARSYVKQFLQAFWGLQKLEEVMDCIDTMQADQTNLINKKNTLTAEVETLNSKVAAIILNANQDAAKIIADAEAKATTIVASVANKEESLAKLNAEIGEAENALDALKKKTEAEDARLAKIQAAVEEHKTNLSKLLK